MIASRVDNARLNDIVGQASVTIMTFIVIELRSKFYFIGFLHFSAIHYAKIMHEKVFSEEVNDFLLIVCWTPAKSQ